MAKKDVFILSDTKILRLIKCVVASLWKQGFQNQKDYSGENAVQDALVALLEKNPDPNQIVNPNHLFVAAKRLLIEHKRVRKNQAENLGGDADLVSRDEHGKDELGCQLGCTSRRRKIDVDREYYEECDPLDVYERCETIEEEVDTDEYTLQMWPRNREIR